MNKESEELNMCDACCERQAHGLNGLTWHGKKNIAPEHYGLSDEELYQVGYAVLDRAKYEGVKLCIKHATSQIPDLVKDLEAEQKRRAVNKFKAECNQDYFRPEHDASVTTR